MIFAAVVLCGAVAYSVAMLRLPRGAGQGAGGEKQPKKAEEQMRLVPGKRCRMMVLAARVPQRKPDGQEWDRDGKGNLPDPLFVLRTADHYYRSPSPRLEPSASSSRPVTTPSASGYCSDRCSFRSPVSACCSRSLGWPRRAGRWASGWA